MRLSFLLRGQLISLGAPSVDLRVDVVHLLVLLLWSLGVWSRSSSRTSASSSPWSQSPRTESSTGALVAFAPAAPEQELLSSSRSLKLRSVVVTEAVTAVWSLDGELKSLSCSVSASVQKHAYFLHDCARLDHLGVVPASAEAWLDAMEPRVDSNYAAAKGAGIDSPLHRAGPVATVLQKAHDTRHGGDYYQLYSFGTGSS